MGQCQSACTNTDERPELERSSAIQYNGERFIIDDSITFEKQSTFAKVQQAARAFCQKNNISQFHVPTISRIIAYRHEFVFEELWKRMSSVERQQFLQDLNNISHDLMDCFYYHFVQKRLQLRESTVRHKTVSQPKVTNESQISNKEKEVLIRYGSDMLKNGKVAVVLMCAGSSSRYEGQDKFLSHFAVGSRSCCILSLLLLRIRRNARGNRDLPIIINCNEFNSSKIQKYLKEKNHFGFNPSKFRFNTTYSLAVFDTNGKYCLNDHLKIIKRPSGTAACAESLLSVGINNFLRNEGIQYVSFSGAENLLQNPADPLFLGIMFCQRRKMGVKCVKPIFQSQGLPRYFSNQQVKNNFELLGAQEQSTLFDTKILGSLPVAMNSVIFEFQYLTEIVADYNHSLFLAERYRVLAKIEKVFNIKTNKIESRSCYSFEKDIRDLVSCVADPILFKVSREKEYAPIISKSDKYCLPMALNYFSQRLRIELDVELS